MNQLIPFAFLVVSMGVSVFTADLPTYPSLRPMLFVIGQVGVFGSSLVLGMLFAGWTP